MLWYTTFCSITWIQQLVAWYFKCMGMHESLWRLSSKLFIWEERYLGRTLQSSTMKGPNIHDDQIHTTKEWNDKLSHLTQIVQQNWSKPVKISNVSVSMETASHALQPLQPLSSVSILIYSSEGSWEWDYKQIVV